jgi:hypothetical protein
MLDGANSVSRSNVAVFSVQYLQVLQGWRRTRVLRLDIPIPTGKIKAKLHIQTRRVPGPHKLVTAVVAPDELGWYFLISSYALADQPRPKVGVVDTNRSFHSSTNRFHERRAVSKKIYITKQQPSAL